MIRTLIRSLPFQPVGVGPELDWSGPVDRVTVLVGTAPDKAGVLPESWPEKILLPSKFSATEIVAKSTTIKMTARLMVRLLSKKRFLRDDGRILLGMCLMIMRVYQQTGEFKSNGHLGAISIPSIEMRTGYPGVGKVLSVKLGNRSGRYEKDQFLSMTELLL